MRPNSTIVPLDGKISPNVVDHFWTNVDKSGDCWLWTASRIPTGYGRLTIIIDGTRRHVYAHRLSYTFSFGAIPEDMQVCHRCDVPSCVNPSHLFIGTMMDNIRDRDAKGRGRYSHWVRTHKRGSHKKPLTGNVYYASPLSVPVQMQLSGDGVYFAQFVALAQRGLVTKHERC